MILQQTIEFCAFLHSASDIVSASCERIAHVDMSHCFVLTGLQNTVRQIPISCSGDVMWSFRSFARELCPTPGMLLNVQSWSGVERKLLNFFVVFFCI